MPFDLLIGGYGPGIFSTALDPATGQFSAPLTQVAEARDASFLALSPDGRQVAASLESTNRIGLFTIAVPRLSLQESVPSGGKGPCHVSFDGGHILAANYGDGVIARFPIASDGTLQPLTAAAPNQGRGPDAGRQTGPHGHFVGVIGRFVYACDLGTDEVRVLNRQTLATVSSAKVEPGAGVRHLVSVGRYVYAVNEMGCSITTFRRDARTGGLTKVATLPLLPHPKPKGANGAEIVADPRGRFLYVSVREADVISSFRIGRSGGLTPVGTFEAGVKIVRSFAISPDGRWIVAAGQESSSLATLPLDSNAGTVGAVVGRLNTPGMKPTSIVFLSSNN